MTETQNIPVELGRSEAKTERTNAQAENRIQSEGSNKEDRESFSHRQINENKVNESRRQLSPAELAVKAQRDNIPISQLVSKTSEVFGRVAIGDDSGRDLVAGLSQGDIEALKAQEPQQWRGAIRDDEEHADRVTHPINLGAVC